MSLLVVFEILGLFVNTLTVDEMYSLRNRGNLRQPIQMKLSKKQITFSPFLAPRLKSTWNLKHFEKKMVLIAYVFPKFCTAKDVVRKMPKKPCLRTPFDSQLGKGSKDYWNLHSSTLVIFYHQSDGNILRKYNSYWYFKPLDFLLAHWLPVTSTSSVIVRIYGNLFKCSYLRIKKTFSELWDRLACCLSNDVLKLGLFIHLYN